MRLTLRTLLAYVDDILDPADHEELGRKIETSDFATELIHRSRDVVRRLRLGAPPVLVEQSGGVLDAADYGDANIVAEYLDNTLAATEVADFERICLEPGTDSQMHLAEVASCHHILTLVLGEPAEVELRLRRQMYELPQGLGVRKDRLRTEPGHGSGQHSPPLQTGEVAAPPAVQRADQRDSAQGIPDYLRVATKARRRSRQIAVAAALVLGIVGYFTWGFWRPLEPPAELAQAQLDEVEAGLQISDVPGTDPLEAVAEGGSASPSGDAAGGPMSEAPVYSPPVVSTEPLPGDTPIESESTPSEETSASPVLSVESNPIAPVDVMPRADASDATRLPDATAVADSDAPPMAADVGSETAVEDSPVIVQPDAPVQVELAGPMRLGTYLGNGDVLLRHDQQPNKWLRVPPRSALSAGDRLLVLPKFRTHVELAGLNAYLSGGTQVVLGSGVQSDLGAEAELALSIVYGRILLNAGLNGSHVSLELNDQRRQVLLGDSASLAVEVQRLFVPGGDYEQQEAPIDILWYLTSGTVEMPDSGETVQAPAMWATVDGVDGAPRLMDKLPDWIDREPVTALERRARDILTEALRPGEPVGIRLLELIDPQDRGRQREMRTLAAEAGVYVGEFEPFVKALNDPDQKSAWESHINKLRQALTLSPEVASRVREDFVNLRGEQAADDLMQMVRGYGQQAIGTSREEVKEGVLVKLIRWLDDDNLDYRVLAIYNLNEITPTRNLASYRPGLNSTQRQRAIRVYWDRLESNELLPMP